MCACSVCFLHSEKWGDTLDLLCTVWRLFSHVVTGLVRCGMVMVLCALGPTECKKEQSRSTPGCATLRLPRHLIVRKVSTEPSGPCGTTAPLSAGQTERHSVLGPGSFFPFSQRLCLQKLYVKEEKMLYYTHVSKLNLRFKDWGVICSYAFHEY